MEQDRTEADVLWQRALDELKDVLSEVTVLRYFGGTTGVSLERGTLTVLLPEEKEAGQLAPFATFVENALGKVGAPEGTKVTYRKAPKPEPVAVPQASRVGAGAGRVPTQTGLLPTLTFDNFVEGPGNQFPLVMARYVAQHPGDEDSRTNPLFMHGPTGVGKTHLLHAIGNMAVSLNPELKVLYTTSEQLMNEYMHQWSVGGQNDNAKEAFREKYRTPDILLVDDIQYMSGKAGLQNEFFNIFNALKDARRQIVMTSDRAPTEIPDLVDRLVSRFQSGITADVDIPAYETRMNILLLKLRGYPDVTLGQEILEFIAKRVSSSVRALEGALATTVNYARMFPGNPGAITVEVLEKSILKGYIHDEETLVRLTCADIQRAVCDYFGVSMDELTGKSREKKIATPRQIGVFLCRKLTSSSTTDIGRAFNRNHATVLYSSSTVQDLYKKGDSETCTALKALVEKLGKTTGDLN